MMLKNDMRKYIMAGLSFESFIEDYGEEYSREFTMDVMERCWKNTFKLVPKDAWLKYLKTKAAQDVKWLTIVADVLGKEEGIALKDIRAGGMLRDLLESQKEIEADLELGKAYESDLIRLGYDVSH